MEKQWCNRMSGVMHGASSSETNKDDDSNTTTDSGGLDENIGPGREEEASVIELISRLRCQREVNAALKVEQTD